MSLQAYQGYFENGYFYTDGHRMQIPEQRQIILTILEEPALKEQTPASQDKELRRAWLESLDRAISRSAVEICTPMEVVDDDRD